MKNQICIERPQNPHYSRNMILMEKNILAAILNHEAGKKFIRPVFKAFFPNIEDANPLIVDDILTDNPVGGNMLSEFDGLVAYTKSGDYYLLNVHSPIQCVTPTETALEVLSRYKKELNRTNREAPEHAPHFYYLGILPNKDEEELVADPNGHITIGGTDINGQRHTLEVLNMHFEAIKHQKMPPFESTAWNAKWGYLFQEFGAPDFIVPEEKGNKYYQQFFETVRVKIGPSYFNDAQRLQNDDDRDEAKSAESLKEKENNRQNSRQRKSSNMDAHPIRVIVKMRHGSKVRTLFDSTMSAQNDRRGNLN